MSLASLMDRVQNHFKVEEAHAKTNQKFELLAAQVHENAPEQLYQPVLFFNASTRLSGVSLNAGFSILSGHSLRLQGVPVVHLVCERGMSSCVLGTSRTEPPKAMPCRGCIHQSDALFAQSSQERFAFKADAALDEHLVGMDVSRLQQVVWEGLPLGELVLPSARWILRRHNLIENVTTVRILREYIRSAWSMAGQFESLLKQLNPRAVVVFNGQQYPEALLRYLARKAAIPCFSHEVGLRPMTAFFTEGEATAYPLKIPADFELDEAQNTRLDAYLEQRFKGNFKMAGVQFWPQMSELPPEFVEKAAGFKQVVLVFTNVIFDTSQPHANVIFEDMFRWLDAVIATAKEQPDTLFVVRAHPDEARKGKASEESVAAWAARKQIGQLPNIQFYPPEEHVSSYDLIRMAKLVLIYNSTIGLEAAIMGAPVLAAGKSRYSNANCVWLPASPRAWQAELNNMLAAPQIDVPEAFAHNARRFLYYQLWRSSLSFEKFLEPDGIWDGYVTLKDFAWQALLPENSSTLRTISQGILERGSFLLEEDSHEC